MVGGPSAALGARNRTAICSARKWKDGGNAGIKKTVAGFYLFIYIKKIYEKLFSWSSSLFFNPIFFVLCFFKSNFLMFQLYSIFQKKIEYSVFPMLSIS